MKQKSNNNEQEKGRNCEFCNKKVNDDDYFFCYSKYFCCLKCINKYEENLK